MEALAIIFFLLATAIFFLLVFSLLKPQAKIFKKIFRKPLGRKQLVKRLGLAFVVTFMAFVIFAPPADPELANLNIQKNQDVITETFTLQGDVKGKLNSIKVNGEEVEIKDSKLNKEIQLQPGDNEITLLATATVDDVIQEIKNEKYKIYFDYEGMLYAELLKKEQQEAEALKKKLETVPEYEVVRKEGAEDGFTAIMYVEGIIEDYLLTNAIKDFKSKNTDKNMSVMVFEKSEKEHIEGNLESEDLSGLVPHVRANYEKRDSSEQFFLFPDGLEGSKLAVEV